MGAKDEPPKVLEEEGLSDDFFTDAFEKEGGGPVSPKASKDFFHEQIGDAAEPSHGGGEDDDTDGPEPVEVGVDPGVDEEVPPGEAFGSRSNVESPPDGVPPLEQPPLEQPPPEHTGRVFEPPHNDDPPISLPE